MGEPQPVIPLPHAQRLPPSLRSFALAAVAVPARLAAGEPTAEVAFLAAHFAAVADEGEEWAAGLADYLRHPAPADAPLLALAGALELSAPELLAVALAAAVEDDLMVGRALAHLQTPVGGSRPTLSLLATCLADVAPAEASPLDLLATGPAVRAGLLQVLGDALPLPERAVAVPLHLALALRGADAAVAGATLGPGSLPPVPLPPSVHAEAARHARALSAAPGRLLVVRSGSPAEGRAVAAAVAAPLRSRPLYLEGAPPPGLGPWLLCRGLLPVFCLELAPGERRALPPLPGYDGPVVALCGPDGSVEMGGAAGLGWVVGVPGRAERRDLWARAIGGGAAADELASSHRHGSGRIADLGRLAEHRGQLHDRARPGLDDVLAASRGGGGTGLEALAQPIDAPVDDDALVASPALRDELDALLLRCRARDGLVEGLGPSATVRYTPGIRALFVGPSGTGKTLAAAWLATRLGLPLFRVDLASVTSKYIGETEKNLALLLARAEQAEVVLLFDEADSLFGKRTEVRDANDRFANAQTNYLLQRIETFDGIALLTSNSRARFDSAFVRRLDLIIDFPLPGPEERRALWESHLGSGHRLQPGDLNRLAATVDLAGGHIRNAVFTAAALAHHHHRPLELDDLVRGLAGEFRKLGRQLPVELRGGA